MLFREHGHHVGSDLVRGVAVCGNAIRADDYAINFALLHHMTGHVVGNDCDGDVVFGQLPCG